MGGDKQGHEISFLGQLSWGRFLEVRFLAKLIVQIETGHPLGTGAKRGLHD
jgi:hypothetical protein